MEPGTRDQPPRVPRLLWLPEGALALGALFPSPGKTREVPRMMLSHVQEEGNMQSQGGGDANHPLPVQSKSLSLPLLESLGPVFTRIIVTEGTWNPIWGELWPYQN